MHSLTRQLAEVWQLRALLRLMTTREVRSRFTGTALGLAWLYAQPMLTISSYYLVFDVIFKSRLAEGAPTRSVGVYLIVGMVPWIAFMDAASRAMYSLVEAGNLLQKNALAPILFPARSVAASMVTYAPLILLVTLGALIIKGPSVALLWMPVLLLVQLLLSFLLGYALAILAAAMRDTLQIVGFCFSLGIFASPVLFTVSMIPPAYVWLLWLNPMTPMILAMQSILLLGESPDATTWIALTAWLTALALLLNRLIRRSSEHLVDWL